MQFKQAQSYFGQIKSVWAPFSADYRIIPFCTPVLESPDALVIGMNHSDFVPDGGPDSDRIADRFASQVPEENTFVVHNHKFSQGLRGVCKRANIQLTERWIGTNRCAVQTGPDGIEELKRNKHYTKSLQSMDIILRRFVEELRPRNVILVGKFATELYYPNAESRKFAELVPRDQRLGGSEISTRLIPIMHVSRGSFWKMGGERLSEFYLSR